MAAWLRRLRSLSLKSKIDVRHQKVSPLLPLQADREIRRLPAFRSAYACACHPLCEELHASSMPYERIDVNQLCHSRSGHFVPALGAGDYSTDCDRQDVSQTVLDVASRR